MLFPTSYLKKEGLAWCEKMHEPWRRSRFLVCMFFIARVARAKIADSVAILTRDFHGARAIMVGSVAIFVFLFINLF